MSTRIPSGPSLHAMLSVTRPICSCYTTLTLDPKSVQIVASVTAKKKVPHVLLIFFVMEPLVEAIRNSGWSNRSKCTSCWPTVRIQSYCRTNSRRVFTISSPPVTQKEDKTYVCPSYYRVEDVAWPVLVAMR